MYANNFLNEDLFDNWDLKHWVIMEHFLLARPCVWGWIAEISSSQEGIKSNVPVIMHNRDQWLKSLAGTRHFLTYTDFATVMPNHHQETPASDRSVIMKFSEVCLPLETSPRPVPWMWTCPIKTQSHKTRLLPSSFTDISIVSIWCGKYHFCLFKKHWQSFQLKLCNIVKLTYFMTCFVTHVSDSKGRLDWKSNLVCIWVL